MKIEFELDEVKMRKAIRDYRMKYNGSYPNAIYIPVEKATFMGCEILLYGGVHQTEYECLTFSKLHSDGSTTVQISPEV